MAAISVTLSDEQMRKLEQTAQRLNLSVEDLVLFSIDDLLSRPDEAFLQAVESVLHKNAELYRRLA
jgi:antitoxin FitA